MPSADRNTLCGRRACPPSANAGLGYYWQLSRSPTRLDRMQSIYASCLCNRGRLAPMGKREPLGQLPGGLIRSRPVKRHHGRRDPWRAQQLSAPTVADGHDLYEVGAPADSFFEAVNGQGPILNTRGGNGVDLTHRRRQIKRSATRRQYPRGPRLESSFEKKFTWRLLNSFCTRHQHLFHNPNAARHIASWREVTMRHLAGYL